jgi:hypothetical protein
VPTRKTPALAAALALALAGPATALEHTHLEPLWLEPVPPAAPQPYAIPALLNLPAGWSAGDGGVILLSDGPWGDSRTSLMRDRLTAALLDEGAAVLELDVNTARAVADRAGTPGPVPRGRDLLPAIYGALLALRREGGAGLVVALGHGAAGEAALQASTEAAATHHIGEVGPRLAAAAALGPGPARFAAGARPAEAEGWPQRAPRLCHLLARLGAVPQPEAPGNCAQAFPRPPCRNPACRDAGGETAMMARALPRLAAGRAGQVGPGMDQAPEAGRATAGGAPAPLDPAPSASA